MLGFSKKLKMIKFNYQFKIILKENSIYLISLLVALLFFFFMILIIIKQYQAISDKKEFLKTEVTELENKKNLLLYQESLKNEGVDIKKVNQILAKLIPDVEDFFSLLNALEKISQETGFVLSDYSVNLEKSTITKLNISASGSGTREQFFKFLENYLTGGYRLLTIDKLTYQDTGYLKANLNIYFYSGKGVPLIIDQKIEKISEEDKKLIRQLISNAKELEKVESTVQELESYPTKSDPF